MVSRPAVRPDEFAWLLGSGKRERSRWPRLRGVRHPPASSSRTVSHYSLQDHMESGEPLANRLWSDSGFGPVTWRRRICMTVSVLQPCFGLKRPASVVAVRRMSTSKMVASRSTGSSR